ncbi:MAG: trypsin-like peptidase domain-containing protein [Smithella sp.]
MLKLTGVFRLMLFVVLLCCVYVFPVSALTSEEIVNKSKESIVRILIEVEPGETKLLRNYHIKTEKGSNEPIRIKTGTGFIISADGYILTALNVIFPPQFGSSHPIYVRLPKEGDQLAEVIAKDTDRKIACIKIKKFGLKPLLQLDEVPNVGSDVFTMGFPYAADTSVLTDQEPTFSQGKVGALKQSRQEATFIQINTSINLGNSGGPLLGKDGQVLGIILGSPSPEKADRSPFASNLTKMFFDMFLFDFGRSDVPIGIGFATPTKPVIDMLKSAGIDWQKQVVEQTDIKQPAQAADAVKVNPPVTNGGGGNNILSIVGILLAVALVAIAAFLWKRKNASASQEKTPDSIISSPTALSKKTAVSLGTLRCVEGEFKGKNFSVTDKGLWIGRDAECDIKLKSDVISRKHSWIGPVGADIVVKDVESTNGSFVNGKKVQGMQALNNGDTVSFSKSGQESFQFVD